MAITLAVLGAVLGWIILMGMVMSGCTMVRGDDSISIMQLSPGEDVQSRTTTLVGLEVSPLGVDGPQIRLGYVRSQQSRVPGYDTGTKMPNVKMTTKVDGGGAIVAEELEVLDEQPARGWFGR
jgi:hypothetical protein